MEGKKRGPKQMQDPTPKEIREATREIRETWDERTHFIRAGFSPKEADDIMKWIPPSIAFDDIMNIALEEGMEEGISVDVRSLNENSDF